MTVDAMIAQVKKLAVVKRIVTGLRIRKGRKGRVLKIGPSPTNLLNHWRTDRQRCLYFRGCLVLINQRWSRSLQNEAKRLMWGYRDVPSENAFY